RPDPEVEMAEPASPYPMHMLPKHLSRAPISAPWRKGAPRLAAWAVTLTVLAAVLGACGGGGGADEDDPLALAGQPSGSCSQAIMDGHNMEAAGRPAPFLPSIQACGSLAEWTEAAKEFGIDLKGREAQFVDNTCNAVSDEVKALKICQEAKAAVSDPRRVP
ncbi:MAG: hypothetical protein ABR540_10590, partial [Acidimicrobiales bacterium]